MHVVILLCCAFATSLRAQSPSGVFTLLHTKPFVAEVTSVSSSAGGFKLALRADDGGESKYEYFSSNLTPEQQFVEASLTTYDPATQKYAETYPSSIKGDARQEVEWDAKMQTYSLVKQAVPAAAGVQHSGMRRIVSPERIEFHSKTTKADGRVLGESGGDYKRIGP